MPTATADELQAVIDEWVADDNNIGITAAVVTDDGSWQGAAGQDGAGEALVPESAMAIASITKTFVAALVMVLAGQGLVDLDDPIDDYVTVPFDTEGATVRQVLRMQSGFPLDPVESVFEATAEDLDRSWTLADSIAMADADGVRQGTVGGGFDYNNLNYLVIGQLIEEVTGEPFAASLTRDLIEPAGLERVWVQDAQEPEPPLTVSAEMPDLDTVDDDGPWLPSRSLASAAGSTGGMAADAPSIARWGYLLYGGHVIDSALVAQMTAGNPADEDDSYGLGTGLGLHEGELAVGHNGDIGTYHGMLITVPSQAVSVAVLVPAPARNEVEAEVMTREVPAALLEALG